MENNSVLQDWLVELPIRMQSTLILGLRGPDGLSTKYIKQWTRWLRGHAFKPGNPNNVKQFMLVELPPKLLDKSPLAYELYMVPQHYYSHLMHSVQVIAFKHPKEDIQTIANDMYRSMVSTLHLFPESHASFETRLGTMKWPGNVQPDTAEEALNLLAGI